MAEALIRIKDLETGEFEFEVKFSPKIDNNSPSHQLVSDFVKFANLQKENTTQEPVAAEG